MKLTIFAATAASVGRRRAGRGAGHEVTAVVRDPRKFSQESAPSGADLAAPDHAALESAVDGADAVISGLGPRSRSEPGSLAGHAGHRPRDAGGGRAAARRRQRAPIGSPLPRPAEPPKHDPGDGFFMRHLFGHLAHAVFREHYVDLALMEDIVADSGLDWTIGRPPKLTDRPPTGTYRTANGQNIRGGWSVPRADVADLMLRVLDRPVRSGR